MKMCPSAMVFLCLLTFTQVSFAENADDSKKANDDLSGRLMKSGTLAKIKLLDPQSNFVDSETRHKFEAAFPSQDFTGQEHYAYTGLSVTRPELEAILKGGAISSSPGALVDHPNEAVAMIYAQAQKKADAFPVIVQVIAGQPEKITGVTLFYKDGFLADAKRPDPGASPQDTHIGTPVFRFNAVPDDSTGQTIVDLKTDLVSTAAGVTRTVHAKEALAPGDDLEEPQYVTKVMTGESTVNVAPVEGGLFKPFDLTGGQVNMAEITKEGAEAASNPALSTEALDNSSKYEIVVLAISGKLVVESPFYLKPLLLDPAVTNLYVDSLGGALVESQPEYQGRDESVSSPIIVNEGTRAKEGAVEDLAKDGEQEVAVTAAEA
jgi:hypothetical protein